MCIHHSPFLAETIPLAEQGRGSVAPNPMVGALVVKDGSVIATGYHHRYGGRHAEAVALDNAAEAAQGATLYCNLEPCSFTATDKHQPPCTRRIIEAGVDTVVIGQLDPNPRVRGDGVRQLEAAGISVIVEHDDHAFRRFNDVFNTVMTERRPFVHLKTAMSLDGRIATADGTSKWITDDAARTEVHALRAERDAVLVGIGTVRADDPLLTVRGVGADQPVPVVLDTHLRTPLDSQLVRRRGHELIVVAVEPAEHVHTGAHPSPDEFARRREQLEAHGVTVLTTPTTLVPLPSPASTSAPAGTPALAPAPHPPAET
ncbi:MAG: bifunctional diaminohydroxyphosphoribosylaminopyrimidine deaminase/5-amino-6-(5-phosphoribosylamino)uracil reductase RibD, partial [Spirochaeta sp.]|nr:bifunctional diaminohydroxyphosphoribosylaminopyrimidine deaminase/5-amino-6-(5-phosphoribosylamino)uracil reductase RibD [Spirochaeta sp.]